MNVKALEDLETLMLNFPEDHKFDMYTWVSYRDNVTTEAQAVECGTACCAAGWGILMLASWKALGLHILHNRPEDEDGIVEYRALANALDISISAAHQIFNPDEYGSPNNIHPLEVAARIRKVLNA